MHSRAWAVVLLVGVAAAAGTGCGSSGPSAEEKAKAAAQASAARKARQQRLLDAKTRELRATCHRQTDPLVNALAELNSRLGIGLNYDEYTDRVADVKVEYDKADFDGTDNISDLQCLERVAVKAEKAFNRHTQAVNIWSKCVDDIDCDNDSINPSLQEKWSSAERYTDQAKDGYDMIKATTDDLAAG